MQTEVKQRIKPDVKHAERSLLYPKYIKRILDFTLSLIAILLLTPFFIIASVLIKIDSKGSVIFTQVRLGIEAKEFRIYKFRTMITDSPKYQKLGVEVIGDDSRITRVGKYLRRYKIDEIVQLLNVLRGDMSLVGPRPTLPEYMAYYEDWELCRFNVKPGLTGLAQINGNIYLERQEKSYYDVEYSKKISFKTDLVIVFKTIAVVVFGEDKFLNKNNVVIRNDK